MVETPLRRSRRIQSQSDDEEASLASSTRSRGSCGSRASTSNAPATPTRRSTRASARTRAGSATKKELEVIPEAVVAAAAATPSKSARKRGKKSAAPAETEGESEVNKATAKLEEIKEEANEDAADEAVGTNAVAATPAKSAKKKGKNIATSQDNDDRKVDVQIRVEKGTDIPADVDGSSSDAKPATPTRKSPKKKKMDSTKKDTADDKVDVQIKAGEAPEVPVAAAQGAAAETAAVVSPTKKSPAKKSPTKKSPKKRSKSKAPDEEAETPEQTKVEVTTKEAEKAAVATPPKKSPKKKKKDEEDSKATEQATAAVADGESASLDKAAVADTANDDSKVDVQIKPAADAEGAAAETASADAATPAKKSRRKRSKSKTPDKKAKTPGQTTVEAAKEAESAATGTEEKAAVAASPKKSPKKKKKDDEGSNATEQAKVKEPAAVADGKSDSVGKAEIATSAKKSAKKKKKAKDSTPSKSPEQTKESKQGCTDTMDATSPTSALSENPEKKKNRRKRKSKEGADDTPATSGENATEKNKKSKKEKKKRKRKSKEGADDTPATSDTMDATSPTSALPENPEKKKNRRKRKSKEGADDTPATSSENATEKKEKNEKEKKTRKRKSKEVAEDTSATSNTMDATSPTSALSENPKIKKKRHRKKSKEVAEDTPATSNTMDATSPTSALSENPKIKKKRHRKKSKEVAEDTPATSNTMDATSPTSALSENQKKKKKRHKKKAKEGAEVTPATSGKNATEKEGSKPKDEAMEAPKKAKPSQKKKSKGGEGKKSPSKKPHKKERSTKHDKSGKSSKKKKKASSLPVKPHHPPPLVMDVKVHRMRFLKLHPRSILSMATTPSPSVDDDKSSLESRPPVRLAISREGGAVEIVSPQDRWVSVGNVPGVRGREVDALVWVCGNRGSTTESSSEVLGSQASHQVRLVDEQRHLFGCSRDGTIFELDFATKRQKGVIGSGGGGVFCMASMCSRGKCCCSGGKGSSGSCGGYFAAGCEDGTVKIYTIFDRDGGVLGMPQLVATLPSAGNAILSLAWVPGQSSNDDGRMGGSVIFAGVADGTIRRFDCLTSTTTGPISTGTVLAPSKGSASISYRWKSTLRMTVENRGLRESTKVWAIEALSDGTVVSGDSLGHVQVWDGMSGTMTQTFNHNESGADVLCLAVSEDENKIFASGIDSSVRCIQRQSSPPETDGQNNMTLETTPVRKWISSNSHRKHSHDVKALAICPKAKSYTSEPLELLVSGGVDTRICTYMANDFKSSRPKIWYNWPSLSPISVSTEQRLLAVTRDNRVDLYQVNSPEIVDPAKIMNPETRDETKCLVKTISIQSPFNLTCSAISGDGRFLAASDALSLYIFSLKVVSEDGVLDVSPTKLSLHGECKRPATALQFGDKDRLICATNGGNINILKISSESGRDSSVSLEHVFKEHTRDWSTTSHHFPIVFLSLSSDMKWLAAGRFSSGKGAAHVFRLPTSDNDESYQHWWSVPEMDAPTTCIKFLGGGSVESSLAVGCSNNEFYVYNLSRRSLSHWSNDMGLPLLKSLPKELTTRSEPVARIVSNPVTPQGFILGSHGYFCVVDLDQPVPERSRMFPPDHLRAKRLEQIKEDDMAFHPPQKRTKSQDPVTNTNFTICLRYNEILFQDFIAKDEMIIVEEPWMSILEDLPDALARRVYGT